MLFPDKLPIFVEQTKNKLFMEVLGYVLNRPKRDSDGQWLEVEYRDRESFLEGTSKALRVTNSDGRAILNHPAGDKYITEVNFVNYDTDNYIIKVWVRRCEKIINSVKAKETKEA